MRADYEKKLQKVDHLETNYLTIHYHDFMQHDYYENKSQEFSSICTILEGEKSININKSSALVYDKNSFAVIPPYSNVIAKTNVATKALVFLLSSDLLSTVRKKIQVDYPLNDDFSDTKNFYIQSWNFELQESMQKMLRVLLYCNKDKEFFLDLHAQEFVYNLFQIKGMYQAMNVEEGNLIKKTTDFMKENYCQPLTIKKISSDYHMSEASFSQLFKKSTGVNPKQYLTNLKLSKAKSLLESSNVTEVAYDLGYENISHFIALFKNKYGITPKQFKKTYEQGKKFN